MLGAGVCTSAVMSAYRYTAGITGGADSAEMDDEEVERREAAKKLRRRPLSETLEQLGEGRGMSLVRILGFASNIYRYLRPWLRGEEAREVIAEVWHRRQGSTGVGLEATHQFSLS